MPASERTMPSTKSRGRSAIRGSASNLQADLPKSPAGAIAYEWSAQGRI